MRTRPWRFFPFLFIGFFAWGGDAPWWGIVPVMLGIGAVVAWLTVRGPQPVARSDADPLRERLVQLGRADLAAELDRGLAELEALRAWRASIGDLDAEERTARAEADGLRRRAEATADVETAATWRQGADLAERRLTRLGALRGEWERASARIATFEQALKTLRLDLAHLPDSPAAAAEVESHLAQLGREVDALVRAREEVRRLGGVVRGGP